MYALQVLHMLWEASPSQSTASAEYLMCLSIASR